MVPFKALSPGVMTRIVDKFAAELSASLVERDVRISLTDAAREHLAKAGYDSVFGARPLARIMREQLEDRLAGELLFGKLAKGGSVLVDAASAKPAPGADKDTPAKTAKPGRAKTAKPDATKPDAAPARSGTELIFHFESAPPKPRGKPAAKKVLEEVLE